MVNPRKILNEFNEGMGDLKKTNGDQLQAFMGMLQNYYKPTAIDTKMKELISVAVAAYARCEYCIVYHVYKAFEAGAKKDEIMDAALMSVAFGGGPSMTYTVTLVKDSIEEFAGDFE